MSVNYSYPCSPASVEDMTLRDWFAGQALAFIRPALDDEGENPTSDDVAEEAYLIADAMLKAREVKP